MVQDYYKLLQIPSDASPDMIHHQCKKIIRHYNKYPEKYSGVEKKIKKIEKIEDLLSDNVKRKEYNQLLSEFQKNNSTGKNKFCKKCGKIIPEDSQFCKHCGENITSVFSDTKIRSRTEYVGSGVQSQYEHKLSDNKHEVVADKNIYFTFKTEYNNSFFDFSFLQSIGAIILWFCFFFLISLFSYLFAIAIFGSSILSILIALVISFVMTTKIIEKFYRFVAKYDNIAIDKLNMNKNQYRLHKFLTIIGALLLMGLLNYVIRSFQ